MSWLDGWWGLPSSSVHKPHRKISQQAHYPARNKAAHKVAYLFVLWHFNVTPFAELAYKLLAHSYPNIKNAPTHIAIAITP